MRACAALARRARACEPAAMEQPPEGPWFNALADFLGPAYLRNAFTMGTVQEVDHLMGALGLGPGSAVLDLGCGPGRHALELARRGVRVLGVDRSPEFVALAARAAAAEGLDAHFVVADVRDLPTGIAFDAAICLCQGGFGLLGGHEDARLLAGFAAALRPGGRLALTAFHAYFAVRWIEPERGDAFDPATGLHHERAELRAPGGERRDFDLWTTCFTARELTLLAEAAGLRVDSVSGVSPGDYGERRPPLEHHEVLLLATAP